jgi:DNA polymerase family A
MRLGAFKFTSVFAWDLETFLIQPYMQAPPPVCMSYKRLWDGGKDAPRVAHVTDRDFWAQLWDALNDDDTIMVAHHAAFEITVLLAATAFDTRWRKAIFAKLKKGGFACTMLLERLIRIGKGNPDDELGLDDCCDGYKIEHNLDKSSWWRLRYGTLIDTPVSQWEQAAIDYSLGDTIVGDLFVKQLDPKNERYFKTAHRELEADVFLALSTMWGVETDHERAVELYEATKLRVEQDRIILAEHGLVRQKKEKGVFKWAKDTKLAKQVLTAAYAQFRLDPPRGDVTFKMLQKALASIGVEVEDDAGPAMTKKRMATRDELDEAREYIAGVKDHPRAAAALETLNGNISLDEESCLGCKDPLMESYTNFSQANTLFGKVKRLQFPLIQAQFLVLGAASGRTSCRQGTDPDPFEAYISWALQLQNPPRAPGVRECLRARAGHAIVSIDFDTFELRTLSQQAYRLFGYSKMREVLMDPSRDVHVELGALIMGITTAEAYALKKADKARFKELRQIAKAVNFGAPGGLGAATFVDFARTTYDVIITEERAAELLELWKVQWPEMREYLEWVGRELARQDPKARQEKRKARGESIILGTEMVRGKCSFCDSANNQFQGAAAYAAKSGLIALGYAMYDEEDSGIFGCRQLVFVHDEYVLEIPLDGLHEKAFRARDIAVAAAQREVPDVLLTATPAAMIHFSKKYGDPVFDEAGRLIPGEWENGRDKTAA